MFHRKQRERERERMGCEVWGVGAEGGRGLQKTIRFIEGYTRGLLKCKSRISRGSNDDTPPSSLRRMLGEPSPHYHPSKMEQETATSVSFDPKPKRRDDLHCSLSTQAMHPLWKSRISACPIRLTATASNLAASALVSQITSSQDSMGKHATHELRGNHQDLPLLFKRQ